MLDLVTFIDVHTITIVSIVSMSAYIVRNLDLRRGDMPNKFPKDALDAINKKTGKHITENEIKKLAGTVEPSTMQNEAQLRQLIKQVASATKLPVSESTINDIINAVKKSGGGPNNLEALMEMFKK